ncbi:hypothetical protein HDU99_000186 [Rhizoclosmatium hyalinum]|nr:hypothetical protein HDU99_000186 [Rhizoclosmatium hyalinum]
MISGFLQRKKSIGQLNLFSSSRSSNRGSTVSMSRSGSRQGEGALSPAPADSPRASTDKVVEVGKSPEVTRSPLTANAAMSPRLPREKVNADLPHPVAPVGLPVSAEKEGEAKGESIPESVSAPAGIEDPVVVAEEVKVEVVEEKVEVVAEKEEVKEEVVEEVKVIESVVIAEETVIKAEEEVSAADAVIAEEPKVEVPAAEAEVPVVEVAAEEPVVVEVDPIPVEEAAAPAPETPEDPAENPYSKDNKYSLATPPANEHQQKMMELLWADSLFSMLCQGLERKDLSKALAPIHDHCLLLVMTTDVPHMGIEAKKTMYYGWKEVRNWLNECFSKNAQLRLTASKLTGTNFRSDAGCLELEYPEEGVYSGSVKGSMEDYLIKSLTFVLSEYDEI